MPTKPSKELVLYREQGKCGSLKTDGSGDRCTRTAGWGTDHPGFGACKWHTGDTPAGVKSAEKERAKLAVEQFGLTREVNPQDALLEEVHRSAGVVAYLQGVVSELGKDDLKQYDTGKEGTHWERASVWVVMYREERAHLVKVAAEAIKCGVAERQVRLAEQQGLLIAQAIKGILVELGVDGHPDAPKIVRRHLSIVAGQAVA